MALAGLVAGVELRRVDQLAARQLGDVRLRVVDVRTGELVGRAVLALPVDGVGVLLGVRPAVDLGPTGLEHLGHDPAELLAREHVHVLRLVGRHQVPVAVGLAVPGGVEVGQAEGVAVLVGDHARLVDRGLGVDVVGADPDEHLVVGGRGGLLRVRRVRPVERPALEVLELVVRGEAGQAGHRVGVVGLQRRGVRPHVVVGGVGVGAAGRAELRRAVAAAAGEDDHEEVDDAVLVRVVVGVVDLRVGDGRRVEDELAGRAAGRVDVLERADTGDGAGDRGAVLVVAVVVGACRAAGRSRPRCARRTAGCPQPAGRLRRGRCRPERVR